MRCEYDGQVLPVTPEGLQDACPECAADIEQHYRECSTCRRALELPDLIDPTAILEAFA